MFPASCSEESFRLIEVQASAVDFLVISDEDRAKLGNIPGFQVHDEDDCRVSQTCQNSDQSLSPPFLQHVTQPPVAQPPVLQSPVAQPPPQTLLPHQPCNHEQAVTTKQPSVLLQRSKSFPDVSNIDKSPNHFQYNKKTVWTYSSNYTNSHSPSEYLNLHPCRLTINQRASIKLMNKDRANNSNSKSRCDFLLSKTKQKCRKSSSGNTNKESAVIDRILKNSVKLVNNCKQSSNLRAQKNNSTYTVSLMDSRPLNNEQDVNVHDIQANKQMSQINCSLDQQLVLNSETDFTIQNRQNSVQSIGNNTGLSNNQQSDDDAISANNAKTLHIRNDLLVTESVGYSLRTLCDENINAVMNCKEISDLSSLNGTYLIHKNQEMTDNISQDQQREAEPVPYIIGNETQQACLGITGNEFASSFTSEIENEKSKSLEKDEITSSCELFANEKNPEVDEERPVMHVKRRLQFSEEKSAINNFEVVLPLSPANSRFSPEIQNFQERIEHISPSILNAADVYESQSTVTNPTKSLFEFTSDDVKQMFDCIWDIYS